MPGSAPLYKEGFVLRKNIMDGPHKKGTINWIKVSSNQTTNLACGLVRDLHVVPSLYKQVHICPGKVVVHFLGLFLCVQLPGERGIGSSTMPTSRDSYSTLDRYCCHVSHTYMYMYTITCSRLKITHLYTFVREKKGGGSQFWRGGEGAGIYSDF